MRRHEEAERDPASRPGTVAAGWRFAWGWLALAWGCGAWAAESPDTLGRRLEAAGWRRIQVHRTANGHLVSPGRLNGQRIQCTVDTGFTYSAVDAARAERLPPLEKSSPEWRELPPGALKGGTRWVRMGHLELGGQRFEAVPALTVEWRRSQGRGWLSQRLGGRQIFDSEVVVGADFLRQHQAVLDYRGKPALYLRAPAGPVAEADTVGDVMRLAGWEPVTLYEIETLGWVLPARFDGLRTTLLVDTGGSVTTVDEDFAREAGARSVGVRAELRGVEGRKAAFRVAQFRLVEIGRFQFADSPIGVADLSAWNLDRTNRSVFAPRGLIGGDFLKASQAVLDCGGRRLWCRVGESQPR